MWTYLLIFLGTKIVWVLGLTLRYNTFAEPARSHNRVLGARNSWFGDLKPKHFWGLFFIISVIITTCSSVSSSISFPFGKYYLIRPLAFPLRPFFHEWSGWAKNPSAFNFWRSVHGKWSIFRRFPHRLLPYWWVRFFFKDVSSIHKPIRVRLYSWKMAAEPFPAAPLHMST